MENENIVKETALSVAKETAKDVYADTVQPTAKNVGGFFGTLSGFFNHVVMYPLKKLNIKYEQKANGDHEMLTLQYLKNNLYPCSIAEQKERRLLTSNLLLKRCL